MSDPALFIDIDFYQKEKDGEMIHGDVFQSMKFDEEERAVAVLSDGLGSGVKANILASLTSCMAMKFVAHDRDIIHSAEIIMGALPVCSERKISYATFTVVDTCLNGPTRIIEMGNPRFLLIRRGHSVQVPYREVSSPQWRDRIIRLSDIEIQGGDRLLLFSDGISQAGINGGENGRQWEEEGLTDFVLEQVEKQPAISSYELSRTIVHAALRQHPDCTAGDDLSCACLYYRKPRKLLVATGPPFDFARDREMAGRVKQFKGRKLICGGTTAEIVSRELEREIDSPVSRVRGVSQRGANGKVRAEELPPPTRMEGIDLVTEGILTLTQTARYLEKGVPDGETDTASMVVRYLRDSDVIEFLVGTRINEAHQDPNLPVDLEIRRNIVKRICRVLEEKYLKKVAIQYM